MKTPLKTQIDICGNVTLHFFKYKREHLSYVFFGKLSGKSSKLL